MHPGLNIAPQDRWNDTIVIEGMRYSCDIFRELALHRMQGKLFRLVSNTNGTLTLHQFATALAEKVEALISKEPKA